MKYKNLLVCFEIKKLNIGSSQCSPGHEDSFLALEFHQKTSMAISGLGQVSQFLPSATFDILKKNKSFLNIIL